LDLSEHTLKNPLLDPVQQWQVLADKGMTSFQGSWKRAHLILL
jgi:hypothetical protein